MLEHVLELLRRGGSTFWKRKKSHSMIGATVFLCGVCRGCFRYCKVLQPTTVPRAHGKTPLCCTSCHPTMLFLLRAKILQMSSRAKENLLTGHGVRKWHRRCGPDRTGKDLTLLLLLQLQHHLLPPPTPYDHPRSSPLLQLNSPETPDLCGLISNFIKPPGFT
jgi:hypothetical protein